MASFFRLITHVVDVADDATDLTLVLKDAAGNTLTPAAVTSWAIPQAGSVADGESVADSVESRPSSHVQHHTIGDSR